LSDKTNPIIVGSAYIHGTPWDVYVSGDYAYVAEGYFGLRVIDISDKTNPVNIGKSDTLQGQAMGVYVLANYAYVAYDYSSPSSRNRRISLQVIDVSDKTSPVIVGSEYIRYIRQGHVMAVDVSGDYAYLVDSYSGLYVINISNKTNPVFVGKYEKLALSMDVDVVGDYAYLTGFTMGLHGNIACLQAIDVSNKANPTVIESIKEKLR